MKVKLLSHRTDLIFSSFEGFITDKNDYLLIKTSSRPDYFWGNFIIMRNPPKKGDYEKWLQIYHSEFGKEQGFMTFTWDTSEPGETEEFIKNGFSLNVNNVLTAEDVVKPLKYNNEIQVREIVSDSDWDQYVEVKCNEGWYLSESSQKSSQKSFLEGQMKSLRAMVDAGLGKRFGAFIGEKLVGELGIYHSGNLGRFNEVSTHTDYRRQGICGTLVYESAKKAFEHMKLKTLVMAAVEGSHAEKIYKSVGFQQSEKQYSLEWYDKGKY